MDYVPCRERTFRLDLAPRFAYHYWLYLHWFKQMLERLGREPAINVWHDAFRDYDEALLMQILAAPWEEALQQDNDEEELAGIPARVFPSPVQGVSSQEAQRLVEGSPPFRQIRQRFPNLHRARPITTYEALHLFRDGLALLAESLLDHHGKEGELIAYDALLAELEEEREPVPVEEFMTRRTNRFTVGPDEPDMFTAGLEVEFLHGSEREVVTLVKECEWARYFQERHPRVGFLLACSLDNAVYRWYNPRIRLQRTTTLMEGGPHCDFRVYTVDQ